MVWKQRARIAVTWFVQLLVAVAFVSIGLAKFFDAAWVRSFDRWGYAQWFRVFIGVVEMSGGALALVPRLASYSAIGLGAVMIGAMVTHARAGQPWTRPIPHFVVFCVLAALRWRDRWRP